MRVERRLSAFDGAMVVVSLVIGIGIFRTPALVAGRTGSDALFLAAWIVGGLVSLGGALVFAEIGARLPRAGGFYKIVAECWHPLAGFLVSWAQLLMQGVGAATVAVIGAEYLMRLAAPGSAGGASVPWIAAALLSGLIAINAAGIRAGARAQTLLSLAKIVLIAALTAAGLLLAPEPAAANAATSPTLPTAGMLAALVAVFYTYGGYQNMMNLAGDVRDPARAMPWIVGGGMAIVTALYAAINVSYLAGLGIDGVAASPLVAADLARAAVGPAGEAFVSLAIFLSAAGFLNATILHMPRAYLAMAGDGLLPAWLGRIDPRTQAQRGGLLFFAATSLLPLLMLESFEKLVSYVMFTDTLSLALLASCLFVLRRREKSSGRWGEGPDGEAKWRMPGYPWLPAAFVAVVLAVATDLLVREPLLATAGLGVVLAGLPIYGLMARRNEQVASPRAQR